MIYCIYYIINNINNKTYIGQHKTNNLNDSYMGSGHLIRKAVEKYGSQNFTKIILAVAQIKQIIDILEKFYIKFYKEQGKCEYNIAEGGLGGFISEEANEKNRLAHLGKKQTSESNLKRSKKLMGHISYFRTEEWRKNHSKNMKGRKHTEETKRKMSEVKKGKPSNTKGKHWKLIDGKKFYY